MTTVMRNLVRVATATTGTGTIALGPGISGALSFAQAGVPDGATVSYAISDGAQSEAGRGVYDATAGTLTRGPLASTAAHAEDRGAGGCARSGDAGMICDLRHAPRSCVPAGL